MRKTVDGGLAVLWLALSLAGAAAPALAAAQPTAPTAGPSSPGEPDYRLGPEDRLRVIVFGETGLSGEFVVSDTGEIAFPLVGDVRAAGLTIAQLQEALRSRLADGYLRDPRVSAEVETHRPFYILGEVQKPGQYPFTSGLTVLNAVATAGGFTYRANTRTIVIRRAGAARETAVRLTAVSPVGPGDTILVKERLF